MKETTQALLPLPNGLREHLQSQIDPLLQMWMERKAIPPAILLSGPSGFGKRSLAYWIAQWVFCQAEGLSTQGPCGNCKSCLLAPKSHLGSWVDFTELAPEEEAESRTGGSLKIEDFREIKSKQGFGGHESSSRIFLIRNAEKMTVAAGNSILKIVEEPPPGWIFIFTCNDESTILPTLLSRCQRIRLRPLNQEQLFSIATQLGLPETLARNSALRSQGSFGKLMDFIKKNTFSKTSTDSNETLDPVARFLAQPKKEFHSLLDWASTSPAHYLTLLDELEFFARDTLCTNGKIKVSENFLETLAKSREQASLPLNRKLVVQDLLLYFI